MFGKLIKHEFKRSGRTILVTYIVVAVLAVFLLIETATGATTFKALNGMMLSLAGSVTVLMTLISVVKNFNDSLYGRRGYLSFTLPVKCNNLLLSKIVVSSIWILCSIILMGLIYLFLYITISSENLEGFGTIKSLLEESGLAEILPSKTVVVEALFAAAMLLLVNIITVVGFIFFAVSVANTRIFRAHSRLYGIIIILVTYITTNLISKQITQKFPLAIHITTKSLVLNFTSMDSSRAIFSFGIGGTIFKFIIAIGLLIATGWIMENKVNVK